MRILYILLLSVSVITLKVHEHSRIERQINSIPLVYPYGAIYKLLVGFASPVPSADGIGLIFGVNFQYQYAQFTNISQLSKYYFIKKVSRELQRDEDFIETERDVEGRGHERLVFYKSVEDLMTVKGMNGPSCMLRAICEAAQFPVEDDGFVGEILHVLLTPDYGRTPFDDPESADTWAEMSSYTDAATAGRQMFSCQAIYGGCPEGKGLMELISALTDDSPNTYV